MRKQAAKELSGYKVPKVMLVLADHEVPVLPNGKPDKRKLREMLAAAPR